MTNGSKIPLDDEPEICEALGRLIAHWAVMEIALKQVLSQLLLTDQSRGITVYDSIVSAKTKIDIIKRLIRDFLPPSQLKKSLRSLIRQADNLNSKRNELVHASWGRHPDGHILLQREGLPHAESKSRTKSSYRITAQDIRNAADSIAIVSGQLLSLHSSNGIVRESSRTPLDPPSTPGTAVLQGSFPKPNAP